MIPIFGHRGARGEAPENTMAGFRHAAFCGVSGIETDISLTADLCPVLHHDPKLPDGRLIRDLNQAELPGVPTLAQALSALPAMDWLIEIKTFPPQPGLSHPPAVMVEAVLKVIEQSGVNPARIALLAFDWAVLREAARRAPDLRLVCLSAPDQEAARAAWWGSGFGGLSTAQAVARFGAGTWAPWHGTLQDDEIHQARQLGLKVIAWTINEPADFQRLSPWLDGVITDHPTRFLHSSFDNAAQR